MVKNGIDVLSRNYRLISKKLHLGLIVNSSSVNARLIHTITIFQDAGYKISAIFAPEHGLWSSSQDQIKENGFFDRHTKTKVYSLYGKTKKPTRAMLEEVDAMVFDVQDIGSRYYTFIWTMALAMEACLEYKKPFIVLDRPNPIKGTAIEGAVLDAKFRSFVGLYPIPIRHGMTSGEVAVFLKKWYFIKLKLDVIKMQDWHRDMWYDDTGLPWVMPSPNMPTLDTAIVYPGMCLLEGTNLSEGRGTTRPFEIFGAPWIDPYRLKQVVDKEDLPGLFLRPLFFKPTFHKYQQENCGGLQIHVMDRNSFKPVLTCVAIIKAIRHFYPRRFSWRRPPYEDERRLLPFDILAGTDTLRNDIESDAPLGKIWARWQGQIRDFQKRRKPCLLYD